jgi:hypothetical protein
MATPAQNPQAAPAFKVLIQNIPTSAPKEELESILNDHKTAALFYMKDSVHASDKGWAFADFEDKASAEKLVATINGVITMKNGTKPLAASLKTQHDFGGLGMVATPQQNMVSASEAARAAAHAAVRNFISYFFAYARIHHTFRTAHQTIFFLIHFYFHHCINIKK